MMNTLIQNMKANLSDKYDNVPNYLREGINYIGDIQLLYSGKRISIIGSRKPTAKGAMVAKAVTEILVQKDIVTVSGLAAGIDRIVHETTIRNNGKTIAVLGTPVDKIYPRSNADIYDIIAERHLLLSQFDENTNTRPSNFPMRNRTMAFISDSTIICDASEKSGTKHQALAALKFNKRLFIASHITDEHKVRWCLELLQKGAQKLDINKVENLSLL